MKYIIHLTNGQTIETDPGQTHDVRMIERVLSGDGVFMFDNIAINASHVVMIGWE